MNIIHPRDYPINAESKSRWETLTNPFTDSTWDHTAEDRWLWEEIAQLHAGIRFLEAIIDKAGAERDQWREESKASAEALRQLRDLMPKL